VEYDVVEGAFAAGFTNSSAGVSSGTAYQSTIGSTGVYDATLVKYNSLSALPVNIISFDATPVYGPDAVRCQWVVDNTEQTCNNYQLVKSVDGINWSLVQHIACDPQNNDDVYIVDDTSPVAGASYYKVAQMDELNQITDEKMSLVMFEKNIRQLSVYPVPATETLHALCYAYAEGTGTLSVYDITGKCVRQFSLMMNNGVNALQLDSSSLPAGHYSMQLIYPDGKMDKTTFIRSE
jgi:hypothetical protein